MGEDSVPSFMADEVATDPACDVEDHRILFAVFDHRCSARTKVMIILLLLMNSSISTLVNSNGPLVIIMEQAAVGHLINEVVFLACARYVDGDTVA